MTKADLLQATRNLTGDAFIDMILDPQYQRTALVEIAAICFAGGVPESQDTLIIKEALKQLISTGEIVFDDVPLTPREWAHDLAEKDQW